MKLITLSDLTNSIYKKLGVDAELARKYAAIVMDYFGYEERVIDNILDCEERRLFYELQKHDILCAESEELILYNGRAWRSHYWRINKNTIFEKDIDVGKEESEPISDEEDSPFTEAESIYKYISDDAWAILKKHHI